MIELGSHRYQGPVEWEECESLRDALELASYLVDYNEAYPSVIRVDSEFPLETGNAEAMTLSTLSPRQLEVAELVSHGYTNREIAARLVVEERTVETHLERIFLRLDLTHRAQLARLVGQEQPS